MTQFHVCVALPAFAAERRAAVTSLLLDAQQSIDISCPPGAQQQTRRMLQQRLIDGTDRQTDGRTLEHSNSGRKKVSTRFDSRYRIDFFSIRFDSAI